MMQRPKITIAISRTPYRIGLSGATDLIPYVKRYGGEALSATIDKYVTILIRRRADKKILFHYALGTEAVENIKDIKHPYVRAILEYTGLTDGVDIASFTDIPFSSGLGSSGAFTVGLLNACWALRDFRKPARNLAEEAAHIEINVLGSPIGKHDQYLAAYGGICRLYFLPDGRVRVRKINLSPKEKKVLENRFLLVHSGMNRSASKVLNPLHVQLERHDVTAINSMHEFRKVAATVARFFEEGDYANFGTSLNDLWDIEKEVFKNSNDRIDGLINAGKKAGASGGIVVGAGGGGYLYYLSKSRRDRQRIEKSLVLEGATIHPFSFTDKGSTIIFKA